MLRIAYLRPKAWPFPKNNVVLGEECWLLSVLADLRTLFPMSLKAILLRKASASRGWRHGILVIFGSSDIWSDKGHTLVFTLRRGNNELNELTLSLQKNATQSHKR